MKRIIIGLMLIPSISFAACPIPDGSSSQCALYTQGNGAATSSAPYSAPAGTCSNTSIGTSATQILPSGGTRNGGGFKVPSGAAQGVYYSWNSASPGTTEGGTTFYAAPGATVSFAGAPTNALYGQAAATTTIACFTE